jgi:hypothetical protein
MFLLQRVPPFAYKCICDKHMILFINVKRFRMGDMGQSGLEGSVTVGWEWEA